MGDRIEPTGSACAPSHLSAPAAGAPTSTVSGASHGPLKVIGVVHAHLHDSRTASGAGEHQHGDLIVRSDGSADSKATLDHYAGMVTDFSRTFNDPTTVQNHALSALSPDPIQKSEGLYKLGGDIVSATPTLVSAAPGAIASGATSTWSALHDYVMSSDDPDAAQRTADRMKAAGSAIYGATLAPLVDDASTLGKTVASSASGRATLGDIGVAGLATGLQAIQWAAPEAKGAGAIAEGTAHVAESEATRAAGDAITRDGAHQTEGVVPSTETAGVGDKAAGAESDLVFQAPNAGRKTTESNRTSADDSRSSATASSAASRRKFVPDQKVVEAYAQAVNSNVPWTWDQLPGGENLTDPQKKAIKSAAVDQGLIPRIPVDRRTREADFSAVASETEMLPRDMWHKSDKEQFKYLDEHLPGGVRPSGMTWHHAQRPGEMQLVPFGIHNVTNHAGGRARGQWADAPR
jgi:hypothetical protein